MVENGQGFCVLSDTEHGIAKALEMQLCQAKNQICARKVYERMRALLHGNHVLA